jgi:hypothetical protein
VPEESFDRHGYDLEHRHLSDLEQAASVPVVVV